MKTVLIFGSSCNPPTNGHGNIISNVLELNLFDEIWIAPVYVHIYQDKKLIDFVHRFEMSKIAFEHLSNKIIISDIDKYFYEQNNNKPMQTVNQIKNLKEMYKDIKFNFAAGMDVYNDILNNKWGDSNYILNNIDFYIFSRDNYEQIESNENKCKFINTKKCINISSTYIRNNIHCSYSIDNMNSKVYKYIIEHNLY